MHREKIKHYSTRVRVFLDLLQRDFITERVNFNAEYFVTDEPVVFEDISNYEMKPIKTGEQWGNDWQCSWLHLTGQLPAAWQGQKIIARLNVGGEGLIFNNAGMPLQGITESSIFWASFHFESALPA